MRVVITGGAGFLGSRLARKSLERGTLIGADGAQHVVRDDTALTPLSPYGAEKAMGELLVFSEG